MNKTQVIVIMVCSIMIVLIFLNVLGEVQQASQGCYYQPPKLQTFLPLFGGIILLIAIGMILSGGKDDESSPICESQP